MFGIDSIINLAGTVIDKIFPDKTKAEEAKMKLMEMQQAGELAYLDAELKTSLAQIEVNKVEAANASLFVSGWRPFIGWSGGACFIYVVMLYPFAKAALPTMPDVPVDIVLYVVGGLLGLNGLGRSYEKAKGVATTALTPKAAAN